MKVLCHKSDAAFASGGCRCIPAAFGMLKHASLKLSWPLSSERWIEIRRITMVPKLVFKVISRRRAEDTSTDDVCVTLI